MVHSTLSGQLYPNKIVYILDLVYVMCLEISARMVWHITVMPHMYQVCPISSHNDSIKQKTKEI